MQHVVEGLSDAAREVSKTLDPLLSLEVFFHAPEIRDVLNAPDKAHGAACGI